MEAAGGVWCVRQAGFDFGVGEGGLDGFVSQFDLNWDEVGLGLDPGFGLAGVHRLPKPLDLALGGEGQVVKGCVAEPVDLAGVIRGRLAQVIGHDPFGKIVKLGEVFTKTGGERSFVPHQIERLFVRRAGPHFARSFDFGIEGVCGKGSFRRDPLTDLLFGGRIDIGIPFGHFDGHAAELALPHRVGFHGYERGVVGEMFKDLAVFAKQRPKLFFTIVRVARPQDVMVGAGHVADGVDLYEAQIADDLQCVGLAGLGLDDAVGVQPEGAGLAVGDPKHGPVGLRCAGRRGWIRRRG